MSTRRAFVGGMAALASASVLPVRAATVLDVRQFGARGDGRTDDAPAIRRAIDASRAAGGPVTLRFPAGDYWLGESRGEERVAVADVSDLTFAGEQARFRTRTLRSAPPMFHVRDARRVRFQGLSFRDDGLNRNVHGHGAPSIYLAGEGVHGVEDVTVADCVFDHVLSGVTASGRRSRVRGITLERLEVRHSYYGLNFQDNGDGVRGSALRFTDCRRSYFPYGVDDHDLSFVSEANRTGSTDILIKSYTRPTTRLRIRARSVGKGQGDAIVAFEHEHVEARGVIRDIDLHLDVESTDCRLKSVVVFRSYAPGGQLETETRSTWSDIRVDGEAKICAPATQWMQMMSAPAEEAVVRIGRHVDRRLVPSAPVAGYRFIQE